MGSVLDKEREQTLDMDSCLWCRINHESKNPCPLREIHKAYRPFVESDDTIAYVYKSLFDFTQTVPCVMLRMNPEILRIGNKE